MGFEEFWSDHADRQVEDVFDLGRIRSNVGWIVNPPDKGLYLVFETGFLPLQL